MRHIIDIDPTIQPHGWRILAHVDASDRCTAVQSAADVFMTAQQVRPPSIANLLRNAFRILRGDRPYPLANPGVNDPILGTFLCDVDEVGNFEIGRRPTVRELNRYRRGF